MTCPPHILTFKTDLYQLCYSLAWRGIEAELLPLCLGGGLGGGDAAATGAPCMGVLAWSPLLQGILCGKFATADEVPRGRARTRLFANAGGAGSRPFGRHGEAGHEAALFAALDRIRAIAAGAGESMATLALAWVATRRGVTSVLMGARTPAQVERNLRCLDYVARFAAGNAATLRLMDQLTDATEQLRAGVFGGAANLDPYESSATSRIK